MRIQWDRVGGEERPERAELEQRPDGTERGGVQRYVADQRLTRAGVLGGAREARGGGEREEEKGNVEEKRERTHLGKGWYWRERDWESTDESTDYWEWVYLGFWVGFIQVGWGLVGFLFVSGFSWMELLMEVAGMGSVPRPRCMETSQSMGRRQKGLTALTWERRCSCFSRVLDTNLISGGKAGD